MSNIIIYCKSGGDEGMGHVVRCRHLAEVLMDKGCDVEVMTNTHERGVAYLQGYGIEAIMGDFLRPHVFACNTLVVDLRLNDDDFLVSVRPCIDKLVVVVGAGYTITRRTHWLADLVVYQAPLLSDQLKKVPGEKKLRGLEYIMVDPAYADVDLEDERDIDALVYVGGGVPRDYSSKLVYGLRHKGMQIVYTTAGSLWNDNLVDILPRCKVFVGTMGMIVYEALVTRTYPIVIGRSEDHVRSAKALHRRVLCRGMKVDVGPDQLVADVVERLRIDVDTTRPAPQRYSQPDGFGVYRVAEEVLGL